MTNLQVTCGSPASLDTDFNSTGIHTLSDITGSGDNLEEIYDIVIDSSDNVYAVGYTHNGSDKDMFIAKFKADGSLDAAFGSSGKKYLHGSAGGSGNDEAKAVVIDSNGKIVITGYSTNASGNADMVVWRLNADGTMDTTLDSDGIAVFDGAKAADEPDYGEDIVIDSNGKIIITGSAGNTRHMVIWRLNNNGSLDTTFDSDGIVTKGGTITIGGNSNDYGNALALDSSGKIVVTGYAAKFGADDAMAIWRYNTDGTPDTSFDTNGIVTHDGAAGGTDRDDIANDIVISSSGAILIAGTSKNAANNDDIVVWQYLSTGALDTSFDTDGFAVYNNGTNNDKGNSLSIDASGKILVTGSSGTSNWDMIVLKMKSDGSLDTSFDTDGVLTHNGAAGGNGHDTAFALKLDNIGRIVIGGYSTGASNRDASIWRYWP